MISFLFQYAQAVIEISDLLGLSFIGKKDNRVPINKYISDVIFFYNKKNIKKQIFSYYNCFFLLEI